MSLPSVPVAVCGTILAIGSCACALDVAAVPKQEADQWLRWAIPLPKRASIGKKAIVRVSALRIVLPENATELDRRAAAELQALFKDKAAVDVPASAARTPAVFEIVLARAARDEIRDHPNLDQAYRIAPLPPSRSGPIAGIRLAGLTPVGTYYAGKTLKQLLAPRIEGKGALAKVEVPMAEVEDWPDLAERGEWGGSSHADLEWMADRKFNLIEAHAKVSVDGKGVGHAVMDPRLMARARAHAVRIVPIIHHLEQLANSGIFQAYPKLKGIGTPKSICFAQPEVVKLVAEWLAELAAIEGVGDVMIWLSEEGKGCECTECQKQDRFVNETRVCVSAWRKAKQAHPRLGLRLLLTQASYKSNDKVLAAVPEDVKVSYYHGSLTYDASRREMIYPLLADYAKKGRWLGVYPTVTASWRIVAPFSCPQLIKFRMTEFVDKGLECLVAYAVPSNWYYEVNVEAAMEWSWNAHGRDEREFAAAYAARRGIEPPETFAQWAAVLGEVSWDVYGSEFPYREAYGGTDQIVRGGIKLGTGIFDEFKRGEQFDEDLAKCGQAMKLAQAMGHEATILETEIVQGYVRILKSVWNLSQLVHGKEGVRPADRAQAEQYFALFRQGARAVVGQMPKWAAAASPRLKEEPAKRFLDTIMVIDRLAGRMGDLAEECGFDDPDKAYRLRTIGTWHTKEFEDKPSQVRTMDVTKCIVGAGTYILKFKYRRGRLGLTASQVQLVSHPKDKPEDRRQEAVDKHSCHAGAWVKGDTYCLELKEHDAGRTYLVIASIRGGKTTEGEIFLHKERPEGRE